MSGWGSGNVSDDMIKEYVEQQYHESDTDFVLRVSTPHRLPTAQARSSLFIEAFAQGEG